VRVLRPDIACSPARTGLQANTQEPSGMDSCLQWQQPPIGPFDPGEPQYADHRRDAAFDVRLGLDQIDGISTETAERIAEQRPFDGIADVARRCGLSTTQMEALATSGAFDSFGLSRRQALWLAGSREGAGQLAGTGI